MEGTESKSANQLYKESGCKISFKEWLNEQKNSSENFIKNTKLNDLIAKETISFNYQKNDKVFEIPRTILIVSTIILTSVVIYKFYKN